MRRHPPRPHLTQTCDDPGGSSSEVVVDNQEVAVLQTPTLRPPSTGMSVLIVVFAGTTAVGVTSGAAAVAALPAIFAGVAVLMNLLRR